MTLAERKQTAAIALDQAKARVPVVIHVGTADAGSAVELAQHAAEHKADAVAIVPPYYYSDHTEYEIVARYKAVAQAVPLPISFTKTQILRHFRSAGFCHANERTGADTQRNQSSLWPGGVARIRQTSAGRFGLHRQCRSLWAVPFGLAGMINPPTSFVPELCVELWRALDTKEYARAVEAQKRVDTAARIVAARLRKYGRVPLQEVFRMRGFAVKRFPKWDTEQMPREEIAKN